MAEILRYVRTNADANGNGTVDADTGTSNNWAYDSLLTAVNSEQQALAGTGDTLRILVTDIAGGSEVSFAEIIITGYTTSVTEFITIEVDVPVRHDGTQGSGYSFSNSQDFTNTFDIQEDNVRIIGMEAVRTGTNDDAYAVNAAGQTDIRIEKCIGQGRNVGFDVTIGAAGSVVWVWNCLAIGTSEPGIRCNSANTTMTVENCSVIDCGTGSSQIAFRRQAGTMIANNIIVSNPNIPQINSFLNYLGVSSGTNNLSEDNSAPGSNPQTGVVPVFKVPANDFRLDSTDTNAQLNGSDRSGGTIGFTDDVEGTTRTVAWDIGFHEESAGAPPAGGFLPAFAQGSNAMIQGVG